MAAILLGQVMPIQPRWPISRLKFASMPVQDSAFSTGLRSAPACDRPIRCAGSRGPPGATLQPQAKAAGAES
jgi:hypothetical protein